MLPSTVIFYLLIYYYSLQGLQGGRVLLPTFKWRHTQYRKHYHDLLPSLASSSRKILGVSLDERASAMVNRVQHTRGFSLFIFSFIIFTYSFSASKGYLYTVLKHFQSSNFFFLQNFTIELKKRVKTYAHFCLTRGG